MKYVLDSSVALKWVLPEPDSGIALRLLDEANNAVHELIAPDIFTPEVANCLATAERQGRIKPGEAATLLLDIIRQAPAIHPSSAHPSQYRGSPAAIMSARFTATSTSRTL
jgi:predicted nucleic acid-binding protein